MDSKAECDQLNLAHVTMKKIKKRRNENKQTTRKKADRKKMFGDEVYITGISRTKYD